MYSKILVPYDISNPADNALKHAVALAKALPDSEIILLHVVTEVPIYPIIENAIRSRKKSKITAFGEHVQNVYSAIKEETTRILEAKKQEYKGEGVDRIRIEILLGKPIDKILEYAASEKVELIVMGSTGLGSIAMRIFLGSVTRGVLERAKCPVTVVH